MRKRLILIFFVVLLLGVGALVYLGQMRARSAELYYSGTIEATEANVAFQVSGRVQEVLVDEGHPVTTGMVLARLDPAEYRARRDQASANLEQAVKAARQAEAILSLEEGALPAEVSRAQAGVEALQANLAELEAGYRSQDIRRAQEASLAAEATMQEALRDRDRYARLFEQQVVSARERDTYTLRYETALREYERAKAALDLAREGFRKESIDAARARLMEGRAALEQARSNLKKIEAARSDLEAARAGVAAATAALDLAETQLAHTVLEAPFAGVITSRNIEPGEVISPTREVLTITDLSAVKLKIFVNETEIGRVRPGQKATVKIDTFPGKSYSGTVIYVSPEAEFTPKIIQTHKERVKLVYLVKIRLLNADLELKPGMPADAWLH